MTDTQYRKNSKKRRLQQQRMALGGIAFCLALVMVLLFTRHFGSAASDRFTEQPTGSGQPAAPAATAPVVRPQLPAGLEWQETTEQDLSEGTLTLVNAAHGFDPQIAQTVSIYEQKTDSYLVKDIYLSVTQEAMDALNEWMDAFAEQSGKTDINIVAGWRSRDDQSGLYQNAVENRGQSYADAYIALPGHSEHHTGLAVDLDTYNLEDGTSGGFDGIGVYAWAVEHAWEYGFIQRYPPQKSDITGINYESWHFRYVGLPHAYVMQKENLCLEEYIDCLRSYPFTGEHLFVTCLGEQFEIYFCPAGQLAVPADGSYQVSGNNVDGFVVTVCHG